MIKLVFLSFVLLSSQVVTGAFWSFFSPHHNHHRVVIEFEDNGKVSISQPELPGVFNKFRNTVCGVFENTKQFKNHAVEVIDKVVGKAGEKAVGVIGKAGKTIGIVDEDTEGKIKDSVVKLEEWDPVDSPKRICEDIGHNASAKLEQEVEEVKKTVENVMETSPNEVLTRLKTEINEVSNVVFSWRLVMGGCHLLGFSIAYGMGVWVTFVSGCVLGKCLPKQEGVMVLKMMNIVYFRAMGCCVGVALFGFLVSQGRRGCLSNKMEMFQGFCLVFALVMVLINLVFLEPRATKFIALRMKGTRETKNVAAEKLKKINTYMSTLNVSTMVVLTWHLAYIGQLLQP